jgi:ATP-dependent RNA helicase DHX8/PRP22
MPGNIGRLTGIKIEHEDAVDEEGGNTYNDEWEVSRLTYMGVISKKARRNANEEIEDINIEVNDREPPFLTGQTTKTGINLSPVRVIKNP